MSDEEIRALYVFERNGGPLLEVRVKTLHVTAFLDPGKTYVLEASMLSGDWETYLPPFTASSSSFEADVEIFGEKRFFRIRKIASP